MGKLFGTDGVRGVANEDLTPDLALALGRAAGLALFNGSGETVIGRDTRASGAMLESALCAGLNSAGIHVRRMGVVPTPAVAHAVVTRGLTAGAMISASHNPVPDNGIKFFSETGRKISGDQEAAIEKLLTEPPRRLPTGTDVGSAIDAPAAVDAYLEHLTGSITRSLNGLKIVLDCAYGAAWELGPAAFRAAGAEVVAINNEADGARINVDCGSTSLAGLARRVQDEGAHLGLGFDGDADRVLAVDENGATVDGDRLIALCALHMHAEGTLRHDVVVSTVMANLGFKRALEHHGISVIQAPVGDRFVVEEMVEHGAVLGGEQSGHIIFFEHSTTGDGILAGLKVAEIVGETGKALSELSDVFEDVPQELINVRVSNRDGLEDAAGVWDEVRRAENSLGDEGRVLLRASGTEPLIRVMVEATDPGVARRTAEDLAEVVARELS